jgi:hypothetical protein
MSRREGLFALSGCVTGALVTYGSIWLFDVHPGAAQPGDVSTMGTAQDGRPEREEASIDPAMVANANLVESLRECSQKLSLLSEDDSRAEQRLEAERLAEADASRSAQARRLARRDPSQSDWKQMASVGTVRYLLPCASFNPAPEMLDRLGLAPRDVPTIQSAFTAARDTAWSQIRPLCAAAAGSTATADTLGLESCPQVILNAERTTNPAAAESALRAVGAVKAGLADSSTIPASDPVGAAFLELTGVAKDAENRLASVIGPEDARSAVYGTGSCGRTSEFTSAPGALAQ